MQRHLPPFVHIFEATHLIIPPDIRMTCMLAGHQHAAGRCTNRSAAVMLCESQAFLRHSVKMRGFDLCLSVTSQLTIPKVIRVYVNDVWQPSLRHEAFGCHHQQHCKASLKVYHSGGDSEGIWNKKASAMILVKNQIFHKANNHFHG